MNITWIFNVVTVGFGEVVSVCVIGYILLNVLNKYRGIFHMDEQ